MNNKRKMKKKMKKKKRTFSKISKLAQLRNKKSKENDKFEVSITMCSIDKYNSIWIKHSALFTIEMFTTIVPGK
jgi:hypothetical protein